MFGRAVVAAMLLASTALADRENADPKMDAMLDGMETLCGERYAGSLDSRDRGHLYCIRAYTAHCALKKDENPRERRTLAQSCSTVSECPYCPGSVKPTKRCVVEFERYKRPRRVAQTNSHCERSLVDGIAMPGGPDSDIDMEVRRVLVSDRKLGGMLPNCATDFSKYRRYCLCLERAETQATLEKQEHSRASRKAWEKEYQAALARAEAAGCDLVMTR